MLDDGTHCSRGLTILEYIVRLVLFSLEFVFVILCGGLNISDF